MKTLYFYIITVLIVSVAIIIIIEFPIQYNGTIMIMPSRPSGINDILGDIQQAKSSSENDCGQFYTVPEDNHVLDVYPVLVLQKNSVGCAKLTYTINYMYNDNRSGSVWSQMLNFTHLIHISKYRYTTSGSSYSMSSIDATHMFKIKSIPEMVDLAKYPVGSQFTVTLVIQPLSNATGFYDDAIAEPPCDAYPLAVGYSLDQVNSSDFSKGMVLMHSHSCANGPYAISSVQVSGMDFKLVQFQ